MMRKLRFDWLMCILTMLFSSVAIAVCVATREQWVTDDASEMAWSAMMLTLPIVFSLIGVTVAEAIHSTSYVIKKKGSRVLSFICAIIVSVLLGVCGQGFFNVLVGGSFETSVIPAEEEESEVYEEVDADAVILLDYSHGMYESIEEYPQTVKALLDDMNEDNNIQLITYANEVFEKTDMGKLSKADKENIEDSLENIFHTGGSNSFNEAMRMAVEALVNEGEDNKRAIILIGDEEKEIDEDIKEEIRRNRIYLYTVTLYGTKGDVVDFAKKSGGFNLEYKGKRTDFEELINSLQLKNYTVTIEVKPEEVEENYVEDETTSIIFGNENVGVLKFLVRLFMLLLYAFMATGVIYYSVSGRALISAAITAVLASVALLFCGDSMLWVGACYVLLFNTAFTRYYNI